MHRWLPVHPQVGTELREVNGIEEWLLLLLLSQGAMLRARTAAARAARGARGRRRRRELLGASASGRRRPSCSPRPTGEVLQVTACSARQGAGTRFSSACAGECVSACVLCCLLSSCAALVHVSGGSTQPATHGLGASDHSMPCAPPPARSMAALKKQLAAAKAGAAAEAAGGEDDGSVPLEWGRILSEEDFERIRQLKHRRLVEQAMQVGRAGRRCRCGAGWRRRGGPRRCRWGAQAVESWSGRCRFPPSPPPHHHPPTPPSLFPFCWWQSGWGAGMLCGVLQAIMAAVVSGG